MRQATALTWMVLSLFDDVLVMTDGTIITNDIHLVSGSSDFDDISLIDFGGIVDLDGVEVCSMVVLVMTVSRSLRTIFVCDDRWRRRLLTIAFAD